MNTIAAKTSLKINNQLPDQVSQNIELRTFAANHSKSETRLPGLSLTKIDKEGDRHC
jgi:hypothetical protein